MHTRLFLPVVTLFIVLLVFTFPAMGNPHAAQQQSEMWDEVHEHIVLPCVKVGWFLLPNTYRAKNTMREHHLKVALLPEFYEAINTYLSVLKSMSLPKDTHSNVLKTMGLSNNEAIEVYTALKTDCILGLREHFSEQRDKGKPIQGIATMLDYTKTSEFVDNIVGTIIEVSGKKHSAIAGIMHRPGTPPYW